jgi:isocitrate dehydrogenase (NAD+)
VSHTVTLIPGDGIGPEVIAAARRVLDAALPTIVWDTQELGAASVASGSEPITDATLDSVRRNAVALKGPLQSPTGPSVHGPLNVALRSRLGLFAQMRPVRSWDGLLVPAGIDLVVARELTEDFAAGIEFPRGTDGCSEALTTISSLAGRQLDPSTALSVRPVSETATRRFTEFVLTWAERQGRHRVTIVHKASVLRATDGLFLEVSRSVAASHPELEVRDRLVDAFCADLVRNPASVDVVLAPFLYGDIISDIGAALSGGLGLAPGVNYGEATAVFEAAHGTVPARAGRNMADPLAAVLSGCLMLRHLGEAAAADRVDRAVGTVLATGDGLTYDLRADRPTNVISTAELADRIVVEILRESESPVRLPLDRPSSHR